MSIDVTRVDLDYLLKPYITHTLPLLINIRNCLNVTEILLTGTYNINSNKQTFKTV